MQLIVNIGFFVVDINSIPFCFLEMLFCCLVGDADLVCHLTVSFRRPYVQDSE